MKEENDMDSLEILEMYIRKRYETGMAFDNLIYNLKLKQKRRYMNIKLKAGLTVIGFFGAMVGLALGLNSIPDTWLKRYGLLVFDIAAMGGALTFAYFVALDYFKADKVLKEMKKKESDRVF